jgi:hypothetical protein
VTWQTMIQDTIKDPAAATASRWVQLWVERHPRLFSPCPEALYRCSRRRLHPLQLPMCTHSTGSLDGNADVAASTANVHGAGEIERGDAISPSRPPPQ